MPQWQRKRRAVHGICYTCPYSLSGVTGVGRFVETLSERIESRRESMIVYPSPVRSRAAPSDKVVLLAGTSHLDVKLAARTVLILAKSRRNFEILHAHQPHLQSVASLIAARILGKRSILTLHLPVATSPRLVRRSFQKFVDRLSLTLPDTVVAVSPDVARAFGDRGIVVIENGVDVEKFRPSEDLRRQVRESMGLGNEFVWVFAGRWSRHKGVDLLLDAIANPSLADRSYQLLLLGAPAADEPNLVERGLRHKRAISHLRNLGFQEDLGPFLAAGDAFVLPSRVEGMPLAFLEAMASGLPVLASDIPVHQMLIERYGCGWTFRGGNVADLVRAMAEIMDAGVSPEVRVRAREAAVRYHSIDIASSRYEDLYERLFEGTSCT